MSAITLAISNRCPSPEWATFFEIADSNGFGRHRIADAIAMNTWPSRGTAVHGFEVKTDRGDWLRELKHPEKSAPVQRFCDRWWICVDQGDLVREGELPETWGLLVLKSKKLVQVKEAPKLAAEPLTRGFVAVLLRAASARFVDKSVVDDAVEATFQERLARHQTSDAHYRKLAEEEAQSLRGKVHAFEKASGLHLNDYHGPAELGRAAKYVLDGGLVAERRSLEHLRVQAQRAVESIDEVLAAIPAPPPTPPPGERDRLLGESYGKIPKAARLPEFAEVTNANPKI